MVRTPTRACCEDDGLCAEETGHAPPDARNHGSQPLITKVYADNVYILLKLRISVDMDLRRTLASFFIPGGAVLAVLVMMLRRRVLIPDVQFADFCWYAAFGVGILLSLRFHSIRLCFTLLALGLASLAPEALPGGVVVSAIAILVPVNLVLFALLEDRGFTRAELILRGVIFFAQFIAIAFLSRPELADTARVLDHVYLKALPDFGIPQIALLPFAVAIVVFAVRFWTVRKPIEAGYFWATCAAMLAVSSQNTPVGKFYMSASAGLLAISLMESSYRMAYHDELTGLPARRALNDGLMHLTDRYALAVIDIDHFKKFNDTYGHETGDQVLRMVASRLARVSGGGEAFRFGGEEFCILFPGRTVREVFPYLERLRLEICDAPFVLRGPDRPVRTIEDRANPLPHLRIETHVTVSIGVAGADGKMVNVDDSLRAADHAMYRAKQNGRNRIEIATGRKVAVMPKTKDPDVFSPEASTPFR